MIIEFARGVGVLARLIQKANSIFLQDIIPALQYVTKCQIHHPARLPRVIFAERYILNYQFQINCIQIREKLLRCLTTTYISTKICIFTQQGVCFCFVTFSWQNIFGNRVKFNLQYRMTFIVALVTTLE